MDTKTLRSKIAAIPSPIREWYASEKLIDIITEINDRFKISKENQSVISKLLLRLAIKDLDAEYFAGELSTELNLDKNNALAITAEIKRIVLSPLRKGLSDYGIDIALLDKFQMPLIKPKVLSEIKPPMPVAPAGPTIISESFSATAAGAPKVSATGMPPQPPMPSGVPQPKPQQVFSQTAAGISLGAAPLASNKNAAASGAPQPAKPNMDKGWSRQTTQDPVVKLGVITPSMPTPAPAAAGNAGLDANAGAVTPSNPNRASTPSNASASSAQANHMSEFERLDMMKKSATPPPMMLHEVSSGMPTEKTPDFRIAAGMQNQINKTTTPPPMPVRSAVIEFGGSATAQNGSSPRNEFTPTSAATNIPAKPSMPASTGSRQVTEVGFVPPSPRPALPPMPPKAPTAQSQTQQTPANKVIVKDFLGPEK